MPLFCPHVCDVVELGAEEKMVVTDAMRIVAFMANAKASGYLAVIEHPCDAMDVLSVTQDVEIGVFIRRSSCCPKKTRSAEYRMRLVGESSEAGKSFRNGGQIRKNVGLCIWLHSTDHSSGPRMRKQAGPLEYAGYQTCSIGRRSPYARRVLSFAAQALRPPES